MANLGVGATCRLFEGCGCSSGLLLYTAQISRNSNSVDYVNSVVFLCGLEKVILCTLSSSSLSYLLSLLQL